MVMLNIKHYKLIQMCVERFDFYLYMTVCRNLNVICTCYKNPLKKFSF